jgi:hypothetical protein
MSRKPEILILTSVLVILISGATVLAQDFLCLPSDIKEDSVVKVETNISTDGKKMTKVITVKQILTELKAKCLRGKLLDSKRKTIRFYNLQGCWGNPPANYLEILNQQKKELAILRKKYTVVEMTCNPRGIPPQSISRADAKSDNLNQFALDLDLHKNF